MNAIIRSGARMRDKRAIFQWKKTELRDATGAILWIIKRLKMRQVKKKITKIFFSATLIFHPIFTEIRFGTSLYTIFANVCVPIKT